MAGHRAEHLLATLPYGRDNLIQIDLRRQGMGTLTVWKFDTTNGAESALELLKRLQKQELIQLVDGAIVTWPPDRKKPKTEQLRGLTGAGALGGAFWGLLFGLLFFIPLLGMAIGAGMGALMGSMTDVGIHDDFIRKVRDEVTPGTSALFVMSGNVVADRVLAEFKDTGAHLASSNLSSEQEAKLREVFAEDEAQTPAG